MNSKAYTKICVIGIFALIIFSVTLNRIVDPFWYYRDISIKGFNAVKPQFHSYERQIKPIIIKDIKPQVAIFSNSYFEIGLNPKHPGLTQNQKYIGYNFGMMAANWNEVYCNIVYALDNTELKTIIIGIQPEPLPKIDCTSQLKSMGNIDIMTLLLSFDALRGSFNTIRHQNRKQNYTDDGMLYYHRDNKAEIEQVFNFFIKRYSQVISGGNCHIPYKTAHPSLIFQDTPDDMEGLKSLLQNLVNRDIEVKLVIYPSHALWFDLLLACGDVLKRWQSIYNISGIVDNINAVHDKVELWDFQGTSEYFTERIINNNTKFWQDYGHFNYEMGDAMLNTIFNINVNSNINSYDKFGVKITQKSLPERFNEFFDNRLYFLQKNPWFMEDLVAFSR